MSSIVSSFFTAVIPFYPFSNDIIAKNAIKIDIHTMAFARIERERLANIRAVNSLVEKMRSEYNALPKDKRGKRRPGTPSINPFTVRELVQGFISKLKIGDEFTPAMILDYTVEANYVSRARSGIATTISNSIRNLIKDNVITRKSPAVYILNSKTFKAVKMGRPVGVANKTHKLSSKKDGINLRSIYKDDVYVPTLSFMGEAKQKILDMKGKNITIDAVVKSFPKKLTNSQYQTINCSLRRFITMGIMVKKSRGVYAFA